jgi:hypothetical protein
MLCRVCVGAGIAAILSFVAACGDTSSSSPTPSQTGASSTNTAVATSPPATAVSSCLANQLYGALVSDDAAEPRVLTLGIGNTLGTCTLSGPPQIHWYGEAGDLIDASIQRLPTANTSCGTDMTDFTTCVDSAIVNLLGDTPLPAANTNGPVTAVVSVSTNGACADPAVVSAHFIGLAFPGTTLDVQVELSPAVQFTCVTQATLQGYGPSSSTP